MAETIVIDEDTQLCPSEWLDEYAPCLVKQPDDLLTMANDVWFIREPDSELEMQLTAGQIVGFMAYRAYDTFSILVDENGQWSGGGFPSDATHFQVDGSDGLDFYDSVDEVVQCGSEYMTRLDVGEHIIRCWYWSDGEAQFRFDVVDGKGRFTRVEEADAVH